ncbi:hypothetical protein [Gordonia crocea]|nr:hypothetical protein [Gordonia crocea]
MPAAFDQATEYGSGYGGPVKVGYGWDDGAITTVTGASPLRKTALAPTNNATFYLRVYVQRGVTYRTGGGTSNLWYPGCQTKIGGKVVDTRKPSPAPDRKIGEYATCTAYAHQAG